VFWVRVNQSINHWVSLNYTYSQSFFESHSTTNQTLNIKQLEWCRPRTKLNLPIQFRTFDKAIRISKANDGTTWNTCKTFRMIAMLTCELSINIEIVNESTTGFNRKLNTIFYWGIAGMGWVLLPRQYHKNDGGWKEKLWYDWAVLLYDWAVLLYGAETWLIKQATTKKVKVAHNMRLRKTLYISCRDKVRNEKVRALTQQGKLQDVIRLIGWLVFYGTSTQDSSICANL